MVQDETPRPRSKPDNGSAAKGGGNTQRQADKRNPRDPPTRQGKSEVGHRGNKDRGRISSAVILQAFKDLCEESEEGNYIVEWFDTNNFKIICRSAGLEPDKVSALAKELSTLPYRIRKDILLKKIKEGL